MAELPDDPEIPEASVKVTVAESDDTEQLSTPSWCSVPFCHTVEDARDKKSPSKAVNADQC